MTNKIISEVALDYLNSGLSVLPASKERKQPTIGSWKSYQERLPSVEEVKTHFLSTPNALCIVLGKVSGNLEVIDFDNGGELFSAWEKGIPKELFNKLVIETTQSGGFHVAYRCEEEICGNIKLAQGQRYGKLKTLIETRGEGGIILCSPSSGYELIQGDYNDLPIITNDQRVLLLNTAWALDENKKVVDEDIETTPIFKPALSSFEQRPGDDFNNRPDAKEFVQKILLNNDWQFIKSFQDGKEYWQRPNKSSREQHSAILNSNGYFYNYSSNATPFNQNQGYSPFSVYALLNHNGDFSMAAKDLLNQGFGKPTDDSDVDLSALLAKNNKQEVQLKPWQKITNKDIIEVLDGTILGALCGFFAGATNPPLPLEVAILKAIVSASCALSEKNDMPVATTNLSKRYQINAKGAQLARLKINTAGGQVANAYALTVGHSSSGKDIGELLSTAMDYYNWHLGTDGTAEGIFDALMDTPNGLQTISEMMNWLDPKHYLNKSASVFTEMFSKGYFKSNMSKRNSKHARITDYAYPNIYANIQPDVLSEYVKKTDVTSGFLGRFLITRMPMFFGRPKNFDIAKVVGNIIVCIDMFRKKRGTVDVEEDYLDELSQMFIKESPPNLIPTWRRLVNEYGPRFAVMLSITTNLETQTEEVILTQRCWDGAEKLILWFFGHAEKLLMNIENISSIARDRENILIRILRIIKKKTSNGGARWSDISNNVAKGTTKAIRAEALDEMVDRGWIKAEGVKTLIDKGRALKIAERYFIDNLPPDILLD